MAIIGIDFGGTSAKLGMTDGTGRILGRMSVPIDRNGSLDTIVDGVAEAVAGLQEPAGIEAIGIGSPGYADPCTGVLVRGAENVKVLTRGSIPDLLRRRLDRPAFIDNDGICAAAGEMLFGAGRAFRTFAVITLGTGIGGAVVVDRRIVRGAAGEPPEIGALALDPHGITNYSGVPGAFEALASGPALVARYRARAGGSEEAASPQSVFDRAALGDAAAQRTIDETAAVIAQAFGIMVNLLALEACIIGGGISAAGAPLLDAVRSHLPRFTWPLLHDRCQVLPAENGNDAGWLGAAAMALERLGGTSG